VPTDLEKFYEALKHSSKTVLPLAEKMMGQNLTAIQEILAPYPRQPSRTRARTFNTYVRGVGRYPRSAFAGGKVKTKGVKIKRTSERLSARFRTEVRQCEDGILGELKNTASYAGWVLGTKDQSKDPHQVSWHNETGWENSDDAIDKAIPRVNKFLDQMLDDFLKKL